MLVDSVSVGLRLLAMRYALFVVMASGCISSASGDQLTRRASFDLNCPTSNLRYRQIDDRTQGVSGCGKRATYVESCEGPRTSANTNCTWLINGSITSTAPASTPSTNAPIAPSMDEGPTRENAGNGDDAPKQ